MKDFEEIARAADMSLEQKREAVREVIAALGGEIRQVNGLTRIILPALNRGEKRARAKDRT